MKAFGAANRREFLCFVSVALAARPERALAPVEHFMRRIAAEYRAGEVTISQGWVVSWTEAAIQRPDPGNRDA